MFHINTKQADFLQTIDAAIHYFDPDVEQTEEERKYLEIANETIKIELDRFKKSIKEVNAAISLLQTKNTILSGNMAFTLHEISVLEEDNNRKQERIQELKFNIEKRTNFLQEAQLELDSHRRKEAYSTIAEKRAGVKTSKIDFSISKDLKTQAGESEEKLEKALIRIQKITENIKCTHDMIKIARFRLGLESKEQDQLDHQNKRLNEVASTTDFGKKPSVPPLKRPTTALPRSKLVLK